MISDERVTQPPRLGCNRLGKLVSLVELPCCEGPSIFVGYDPLQVVNLADVPTLSFHMEKCESWQELVVRVEDDVII